MYSLFLHVSGNLKEPYIQDINCSVILSIQRGNSASGMRTMKNMLCNSCVVCVASTSTCVVCVVSTSTCVVCVGSTSTCVVCVVSTSTCVVCVVSTSTCVVCVVSTSTCVVCVVSTSTCVVCVVSTSTCVVCAHTWYIHYFQYQNDHFLLMRKLNKVQFFKLTSTQHKAKYKIETQSAHSPALKCPCTEIPFPSMCHTGERKRKTQHMLHQLRSACVFVVQGLHLIIHHLVSASEDIKLVFWMATEIQYLTHHQQFSPWN